MECEQEHDLAGIGDYLTTAQAVEQLQHNLETDHCLLCDFMSITYQQVRCCCALTWQPVWCSGAWAVMALRALALMSFQPLVLGEV